MSWTYSENERQQTDQAVHRMTTQEMEKIIIIINLICIAQLDTNGILTALYIVIKHIQTQYTNIRTCMIQLYSYTYACLHKIQRTT